MIGDSDLLAGTIDVDREIGDVGSDRLYRLWEEGAWSARSLDFTRDAIDWRERVTPEQQQAFLWFAAQFLDGEESVTVTLAPFMEPLTRPEDRVFLATQIADEARHQVFFDRYVREVAGIGVDFSTAIVATRPYLSAGYVQVFDELDRVAVRLRRHPHDLPLLAQGITLYHIVIESMLAHTAQHFLRAFCQREHLLTGFSQGIHYIARDESRHIAFGVQTLHRLVTENAECASAALAMLDRVLPAAAGGFVPPLNDWAWFTRLGFTAAELYTFGLRSLQTKLRRAGIAPERVLQLAKLGFQRTPAEQTERLIRLIEGGAVVSTAEPTPNELTLDALFEATRDVARFTGGAEQGVIQWIFDEPFQPRFLDLAGADGPVIGTGMVAAPRLTLTCTAADWIRIATRQLGQTSAVISRKLKVSGDWRFALRLPAILPM